MKRSTLRIPSNGVAFRKLRHGLGYTQTYVAKLFHVKVGTVHRWEAGKTKLDRSAAVLMGLTFDEKANNNKYAVRDYVRMVLR